MKNFLDNLRWRGMLHSITPGTEAQLNQGLTKGYIGFDLTAPSLHIGNLAAIMLLKHLQLAGHKPIVLLGGGTTLVGDPGGKSEERKLMDPTAILANQASIQKQLSKFLDFHNGDNGAVLLNNDGWLKGFNFLQFLREVGKHIPVPYMIAKESVKSRLATGLSFAEFSYQLLQAYDFYHLYKNHDVKLQMGGADQWGNLTTGTELIRRKAGGQAFALTTPLITKADGRKFGKTEKGTVWLDPTRTSPYQFYQFWLNCTDAEAEKCLKVFTLLEKEHIEALVQSHNATPNERILQKALAKALTTTVHSAAAYEKVAKASALLFGKGCQESLGNLEEEILLAALEAVPQIKVDKNTLENLADVTEFLANATHIFPSKGEVRRTIQGGGLHINKIKITDPYQKPLFDLLQGKYLLVQKGKKNYYLIIVYEQL